MKIKILLFSLMIALFANSCESEEQVVDQQELTLEMKIANSDDPTRGSDDDNCADYVPRVNNGWFEPVESWNIVYSPDLSLDEIECLRMDYFQLFVCLHLSDTPSSANPYEETWELQPCRPDGTDDVGSTIDNDPLIGG